MSTTAYYLVALVLAVAVAMLSRGSEPPLLEVPRKAGVVGHVFNGDTVALSGSGKPRLRLWGVDAPEKDEKGFQAAKFALQRVVENRRISYIEIDRDRYGRIVARIFLPDGQKVNRLMIESGAAREYKRYSKGFYSDG